ncbi:MAG: superoxide dismutase family protein [Actinomycetota bacterium]|nr:superoxide dismutase family protein [Actinomycetota bacterium]
MMYRARRLSGAALAITMFAALALALSASAGAQEDQTMPVNLTQSRDSGVSGTATLDDVKGGVEVTLEMRDLPDPGIKHINHIHAGGTCADDRAGRTAPVTIPLETITAQKDGTGSATTTIEDISAAQLFGEDKERFILLHAETKKGEGVPPGIACADLAPLADTGGIRPATLLLAGAISVLGVAAALFILQRRIGAEN